MMTDALQHITHVAFSGILGFCGFALILMGLKRALGALFKGGIGEKLVSEALKREGVRAAHDLLLPTGEPDSWTQVDHVAAIPGKLVSIETKNMAGKIYASDQGKKWTQFLGKTKSVFQNPIRQNYKHTQAIIGAVKGAVPVENIVVFAGKATFPKGLPNGCCMIADLKKTLEELAVPAGAIPEAEIAALEKLSSSDSVDREKHLADLRAKHGPDRKWLVGLAMVIVGGALLGFALA